MIAGLQQSVLGLIRPWRLTGPILEKELRVSSRRRRNYLLRCVYILLLTAFVVMVWSAVAVRGSSGTFQQSRMAEAGKEIVTTIVVFQFVATQALAVIMLSTAISDEIYHQTLGLLMTTTIDSFQIVLGKLLSKLVQLVLLLAITLPLLAIVRVFGGVPWGYLLSSLCITLTAVIFAGTISLFFSIGNRRAYVVIIKTAFALGVLYFMVPMMVATLLGQLTLGLFSFIGMGSTGSPIFELVLYHVNPFRALMIETLSMLAPGGNRGPGTYQWSVHCSLMLILSGVVLAWSVAIVRKVATRQALGQLDLSPRGASAPRKKTSDGSEETETLSERFTRRVAGAPVIWKELRAPLIYGVDNTNSYIGLSVTILALLITYAIAVAEQCLDDTFAHVAYGLMFLLLGGVFTLVFSATRITAEKESRTWPILLATPLGDWEILLGKTASTVRRCVILWLLLAGHIGLFVLVGYIHPAAFVHMGLVAVWLTCFITGAGLYFSSRFRRTTSAVVANLALVVALWLAGPVVVSLAAGLTGRPDAVFKAMLAHPVAQTVTIMAGAAGTQNAQRPWDSLEYRWGYDTMTVGVLTMRLVCIAAVYVFIGAVLLYLAKRRLRHEVF